MTLLVRYSLRFERFPRPPKSCPGGMLVKMIGRETYLIRKRGQVIILVIIAFFIRFIARSPLAIRCPISFASRLT